MLAGGLLAAVGLVMMGDRTSDHMGGVALVAWGGAVALAGEFTGVYPRPSPGGWHVIGHTDAVMWDPSRPEPALVTPGVGVRFVAVEP